MENGIGSIHNGYAGMNLEEGITEMGMEEVGIDCSSGKELKLAKGKWGREGSAGFVMDAMD